MSINITVAWEEQDRACMDRLSESLDRFAQALNRYTDTIPVPCRAEAGHCKFDEVTEADEGVVPLNPDVIMPSADEVPCGPGPEESEDLPAEIITNANEAPPAKPIDLADFQAAVARYLANGGDRAALKAHLEANYGVGQVRAVPEDKRAEVLAHIGA